MSERPPTDDELERIFKRPADVSFARRLHEVRRPAVEADPAFREALRRRLMQEAWQRKAPRRRWYRRLLGPPGLAWAAAMAGVLLIVFAVTLSQNTGGPVQKVFTSPINGHQEVATTSAIVVNFQQPMNPVATQQATRITPATEAAFHWSDNNQTLTITPKNDGLAPGVEYQVTFTAGARTESNLPLSSSTTPPTPITFVTQQQPPTTPRATPVPSPVTQPSPAPVPSQLSGVRDLGASDGSQPVWSLDGTQIYVIGPGGSLTRFPARGGAGTVIAAGGVSQVVAGPGGAAYLAGTAVSYAGTTTTVPGVTSIGFESTARGPQLFAIAGTRVVPVGAGGSAVTLAAAPTAPGSFSPGGNQLVYLAADGLHLVDLANAADQTVGTATALGAWAPSGASYAYINQGSLSILNVASATPTGIAGMTGVTALSWTNNGLLVSSGAGVQELATPGANATELTAAPAAAASGSPASAQISYVEAGRAYVGTVDTSSALATVSNLITQFMAARQSGNTAEAQSLLTPSAAASFGGTGGLSLTTYQGQTLNRWSLILAQPSGIAVVRTVFAQGTVSTQQSVFDEQFRVGRSGQRYLIGEAAGTLVQTGTTGGPETQNIQVGANSISVKFDSDLNPATVAAGVFVQDAAGNTLVPQTATYSAATRTVSISLPTLTVGVQYRLQIASGLKDVNGQGATHVQLVFTSPTTPMAPVPNPTPTPAPSPSASASPSPSATPSPSPTPSPSASASASPSSSPSPTPSPTPTR